MKRNILSGVALSALALVVAGCSSSSDSTNTDSASPSSSTSAESSASPSSQADSSVTPPSRETVDDADMLRLAVSRFESQLLKVGGATFSITAAGNDKPDQIQIDPSGNERREWKNEEGADAAVYTIVDKGVYTSKTGLDPTGIDLMDTVAPNAVWMLDTFNGSNYVPLTPARVLEATLAYADKIKCDANGKEKTCTITATGMSSMPGLGSFEAPEGGVEVIVTLNGDGDIASMVVFPNNDDFKLSLESVKFEAVTISAPEGETVDYSALVEEQQKRESEAPNNESE